MALRMDRSIKYLPAGMPIGGDSDPGRLRPAESYASPARRSRVRVQALVRRSSFFGKVVGVDLLDIVGSHS